MTEHIPTTPDTNVTAHLRALEASTPTAHAVEAAQLKLEQRLRGTATAQRATPPRRMRWLTFAATATIALALTLTPLLFTDRGALAFSDVQRHFQQFRTLSMRIEQGSAGQLLPIINVAMTEDGQVRTDVAGEVSVVVDPTASRVLMLLHSSRSALRFPIGMDAVAPARDALDWIEQLRDFKGMAMPLTHTRQIDGQTAQGWALAIAGARLELWAAQDGLPLALIVGDGDSAVLDLQFRFRFDEAIPADTFSTDVPAGYNLGLGLGG